MNLPMEVRVHFSGSPFREGQGSDSQPDSVFHCWGRSRECAGWRRTSGPEAAEEERTKRRQAGQDWAALTKENGCFSMLVFQL